MSANRLSEDSSALSPIISIAAMVVFTIIFSIILTIFVFEIHSQVMQATTTATFEFEYEEGTYTDETRATGADGKLRVVHISGDSIKAKNLYITGAAEANGSWAEIDKYGRESHISAGMTLTIDVSDEDLVRVIYRSPTSEENATLGSWNGPT